MARFSSRKFLVCCAIILGGIASVISGACIDNNTLILVGSICSTLSAVIYALVECICDTAAIEEEGNVEIAEDDDTEAVG